MMLRTVILPKLKLRRWNQLTAILRIVKLRKWNQLRLNQLILNFQRWNQLNQPKLKPNPNPPKFFQQTIHPQKKPLQMRSALFRIFYRKSRSWHYSTTLSVMKSKKKQAPMSTLLPPSRVAIHSIWKMSKFSREKCGIKYASGLTAVNGQAMSKPAISPTLTRTGLHGRKNISARFSQKVLPTASLPTGTPQDMRIIPISAHFPAFTRAACAR